MQNASERQKFMRQFGDEPALRTRMVAKTAAGLLIVLLLAVIGSGSEGRSSGDGSVAQSANGAAPATAPLQAEAHRKYVFDERRRHFESQQPQQRMMANADRRAQQSSAAPQ
jgi:hypothetical protein